LYLAKVGTQSQTYKLHSDYLNHKFDTGFKTLKKTFYPSFDYGYNTFYFHWGAFFDQTSPDYIFYHSNYSDFGLGLKFKISNVLIKGLALNNTTYISSTYNSLFGLSFYSDSTSLSSIFSVFGTFPFKVKNETLFSVFGGYRTSDTNSDSVSSKWIGFNLPLTLYNLTNSFNVTMFSDFNLQSFQILNSSENDTSFNKAFQTNLTTDTSSVLLENTLSLSKEKHTFFIKYKHFSSDWILESGSLFRPKPSIKYAIKLVKDSLDSGMSVIGSITWYSQIIWSEL